MKLENSVVLVSGANRGLGLEFSRQALARGAAKVYAASRDPASVTLSGVVPVQLDVTNIENVSKVARDCGDVTVLINNAGIARPGGLIGGDVESRLREQMETNLFGMLNMSQAFAATLGRNGGGGLVNILSALSWINTPAIAGFGVSKAAAWALTNGLRHELRRQGTRVLGVHASFIDTDLTRGIDISKISPEEVVRQTFDALEAGEEEVVVDETARKVKQALSRGVYLNDLINLFDDNQ